MKRFSDSDLSAWAKVWDFWSLDELKSTAANGSEVWVEETEEGCAIVSENGDDLELLYIFVHPRSRGKGIGLDLLQRIFTFAQSKSIFLEVKHNNAPALALYEKAGFVRERIRPRYYKSGEDAIIMVKST